MLHYFDDYWVPLCTALFSTVPHLPPVIAIKAAKLWSNNVHNPDASQPGLIGRPRRVPLAFIKTLALRNPRGAIA